MVFTTTKGGFRSATAAARTFKAAQKLGKPARQKTGRPRDLFDLTPDDEQQMFQEAVRDFAAEKVRPAAAGGRRGADDAAGAARPGERARRQHARRPLRARRGDGGAVGGRRRPDRRGPRPRRHGDRLCGPRPGRGRDRDRPLGHGRPGVDLSARLHRRGHAGGCARDPRAEAALQPARARDQGPPRRRRLGDRRDQVAARPGEGVRAVRRRRRGRGDRAGAVRRSSRAATASRSRTSRRWACGRRPPAA